MQWKELQELWNFCIHYWPDFVVALVLAVIVDVLRVRSRLGEAWRWIKDKNAEGSAAQLSIRIVEQEKYRDTLKSYLASDKVLYLAVLRSIVAMLLFMCIAGVVLILGRLGFPVSELTAFAVLIITIIVGISTLQLGSFDASKLSKLIKRLDAEIAELKEARLKLLKP